jgi:hypothetical protein
MSLGFGFTLQYITCFSLECESEPEPESSNNQQQLQLVVPTTIIMSTEHHQEQSAFQDYEEQQHQHQKQGESGSGGGGLIASGLSWFDKQREKKRREHLKMQAEKQLQKIKDASSLLAADNSIASGNSGGDDDNISSSSLSHHQGHNHNHNRPPPQPIGLSANKSIGSTASVDSADVSCSKSGEGASGKFDLNDVVTLVANNNKNNNENYNINDSNSNSTNNNNDNNNNEDDQEEIITPVRVTHVDGDEDSPYILDTDQMNSIAKNVLPETVMYCRWRRLYSLNRDGDSFDGCLRIIGTSKRTLMVVKTTRGEVFGGYADAPWHSRQSHATAKFYGSASSCLFSFPSSLSSSSLSLPSTATKSKDKNNNGEHQSLISSSSSIIDVYRWTGKNRYIQVCDVSTKLLAFGGGGDKGAFGLCLQEDFQRGTTGHCDTFDNEPLCEEGNFDVVDVEFWEFLTGVF